MALKKIWVAFGTLLLIVAGLWIGFLWLFAQERLESAVHWNNVSKARAAIFFGADVNHIPINPKTGQKMLPALFNAIRNGNTEVAELLLEKGANPTQIGSALDFSISTMLWGPYNHWRRETRQNQKQIIPLLLSAKVPYSEFLPITPFILIDDMSEVERLAVDTKNTIKQGTLKKQQEEALVRAAFLSRNKDMLNYVLNTILEIRDIDRVSLFNAALYAGDLSFFDYLMEKILKIDPYKHINEILNLAFDNNNVAFDYSIINSILDKALEKKGQATSLDGQLLFKALDQIYVHGTSFLKKMLDTGANPNVKNKYGQTPLTDFCRWICSGGNLKLKKDIVELLLKYGADPTITDNIGKSAIDYAKESASVHPKEKECNEVVELLRNAARKGN